MLLLLPLFDCKKVAKICNSQFILQVVPMLLLFPGWVLPEKLGGGVQHTSQNPYPIDDLNQQFSLPYL